MKNVSLGIEGEGVVWHWNHETKVPVWCSGGVYNTTQCVWQCCWLGGCDTQLLWTIVQLVEMVVLAEHKFEKPRNQLLSHEVGETHESIYCYIHLMKMKKLMMKTTKHIAELVTTPVGSCEHNSSVFQIVHAATEKNCWVHLQMKGRTGLERSSTSRYWQHTFQKNSGVLINQGINK